MGNSWNFITNMATQQLPSPTALATFEQAANAFVASHTTSEFIHEGEAVSLTGRYALPVTNPGTTLSPHNIVASMHVEVQSADKDAPKKFWVKFPDLKIVRTIVK